jgi:hypothetical protein
MHRPVGFIYNCDKVSDEYNAYTGHVCFVNRDGNVVDKGNANTLTEHVRFVYRLVHSV